MIMIAFLYNRLSTSHCSGKRSATCTHENQQRVWKILICNSAMTPLKMQVIEVMTYDNSNYLDDTIEKQCRDSKDITQRISQGQMPIKRLNGIWLSSTDYKTM